MNLSQVFCRTNSMKQMGLADSVNKFSSHYFPQTRRDYFKATERTEFYLKGDFSFYVNSAGTQSGEPAGAVFEKGWARALLEGTQDCSHHRRHGCGSS